MDVKENNNIGLWLAILGGAAIVGAVFGFRKGTGVVDFSTQPYFDPTIFSRYYSPEDVVRSNTATSQGIANNPPEKAFTNASILAQMILDPITDYFRVPGSKNFKLQINSWYRSPALNNAVGGSSTSAHLTGSAADIAAPSGVNNIEILKSILEWSLPFDQLIIYPDLSRFHISYDPEVSPMNQRRRILEKTSSGYSTLDYNSLYNELV